MVKVALQFLKSQTNNLMREILLLALVMLLSLTTFAQMENDSTQIQIDEVVILANRIQLPASENSRTINIITRQQIENAPVQSVAQVLQHVAGIDVRQRGVHGVQADVSIRGGTFDQVLILINGIKMADPQTGHHTLNLPLNMENIERIEILKGPAARIFGANAFAGAINIVTKTPDEAFFTINAEGGQNSLGGINLSASLPKGNLKQYFSVGRQFSDGYRHNTDYDISNYLYQSEYQFDASQKLEILGSFTERRFGANRFYGNNSDAFANQYEEVQTSLLNVGYRKVKNNYAINTRLNWRRNQDEYVFIRNNPSIYRNLHISNVINLESHADFYSKAGTTGIGVELSQMYLRSNNLGKHDRTVATIFLEHRFNLLNGKLDITPGISTSFYSDFGTHFFPGVDAGYTLSKGIKVFGNAGYTWRIPTFTDLYYEDSGNLGNENLEPESALSYEAGIKYDRDGIRANLSWFMRDGTDLIDWTRLADTLKWQPSNIANLTMQGFDASVNFSLAHLTKGASFIKNLNFGYTFIDAEVPVLETGLSRYVLENLNHQFNVGLDFLLADKLTFGFRYRYVDRVSMEDYNVLDGKITWRHKNYAIYLAGNNITDTEFFETNLVEMPGRWIYGGVRVKLNYK